MVPTQVDPEPVILDLFRHVTNGAECLSFAFFFSLFILIMIWQMQIFRRVFRLKKEQSIVDPLRIVRVHFLILVYLIIKVTAYGYGLISGQLDYTRRKSLQEDVDLKVSYFNPIVYALLLNISTFSQVTAYILTIQNWLWIIEGLKDHENKLLRFFSKLLTPILILTFFLQGSFIILLFLGEHQYIYKVALMFIILHILLINFMTLSSWTIYKFFKAAYTQSQYLTRAILFVNIGLQTQAIINLLNVTCPDMMILLKHYNTKNKTDTSVNFALIWSIEQLFGSIIPTIFIIILARPILFLYYGTNIVQNPLYKSITHNSEQRSQSKSQSGKSRSKQSNPTHSMNDDSAIHYMSNSQNNLLYIEDSESFNSSDVEQPKEE